MADSQTTPNEALRRTPLIDAHKAAGARLVPFAGYEMPVQYADGIIKEHLWTRQSAGLFDVSHMGQIYIEAGSFEMAASALEALVPADVKGLARGQQRYTQLLNESGGILDDLIIMRPADPDHDGMIHMVINAACKEADIAHIRAHLPQSIKLHVLEDSALLALQGPKAESVLANIAPDAASLGFMQGVRLMIAGEIGAMLTRSGYTGEDGFEISVLSKNAIKLWNLLLSDERVRPIGLGARDTLRLEAGLPLYGHDLDLTTSPVEAGLTWSIGKARREKSTFIGTDRVEREIREGASRKRVGLMVEGRAPIREGAQILSDDSTIIGTVTSGGFSPTLDVPIAMGYVIAPFAAVGTRLTLAQKNRTTAATVHPMPFVPHTYKR
jgi:aminomethyltransferase